MARAKVFLKADSVEYYFDLMRKTLSDTLINSFQFAHYFQEKSFAFYMEDKLDSAEVNILRCMAIITEGNLPITSIMGALTPGYYLALIRIRQNRIKEAISPATGNRQPECSEFAPGNLRRYETAGTGLYPWW